MQIDLHGEQPNDLGLARWGIIGENSSFRKMIREAWEAGETELTFIHGHGHNRGISVGFVHTNTGYLGPCVRRALRHDLSDWVKPSTLDCKDRGLTTIKLKPNKIQKL